MTEQLRKEQLSDLIPNQSLYGRDGKEWVVESVNQNKYTHFAVLRKKDNKDWGTYTLNQSMASQFSLTPPTEDEITLYKAEKQKKETTKPGDSNYFACHCSAEGKEQCALLLKEVKELLKANSSNLLSNIIYSLQFSYNARITSIHADMWSLINSETYDYNPVTLQKKEPLFTTEIQCDDLEDGMAATWYAYYKKFGEKRVRDK
jgi:hypothetical protein